MAGKRKAPQQKRCGASCICGDPGSFAVFFELVLKEGVELGFLLGLPAGLLLLGGLLFPGSGGFALGIQAEMGALRRTTMVSSGAVSGGRPPSSRPAGGASALRRARGSLSCCSRAVSCLCCSCRAARMRSSSSASRSCSRRRLDCTNTTTKLTMATMKSTPKPIITHSSQFEEPPSSSGTGEAVSPAMVTVTLVGGGGIFRAVGVVKVALKVKVEVSETLRSTLMVCAPMARVLA